MPFYFGPKHPLETGRLIRIISLLRDEGNRPRAQKSEVKEKIGIIVESMGRLLGRCQSLPNSSFSNLQLWIK